MVRTFSWVSTRINLADGDRSASSGEYVHDCITQIDVRWARTHEKVHVLITQMVSLDAKKLSFTQSFIIYAHLSLNNFHSLNRS